MNIEKLITKGVERYFDGQKVLFKVASLKEHFDGLLIHDSDILLIEEEAYIRVGDVGFEGATTNEIHPKFNEETPYEKSEEGTVGILPRSLPEEDVDVLIAEANAKIKPTEEIEVVAEVVVPEIVAPKVIVDETPTAKDYSSPYSIAPVGTPAEEIVVKTPKKKKK